MNHLRQTCYATVTLGVLMVGMDCLAEEMPDRMIPRIVKIEGEAEVDSLKKLGVDVLRRRGDILLCFFPNTATRGGESTMRRGRPIAPTLDIAKTYYGAASIQTGEATGTPYTGKGTVVGICDIGIDPLHPTFLDSEGHSRIKRVVQYVERDGLRVQLDGDDDYREWVTDNREEYHATHVCGILAGGGAGTAYAGVAPDADIVVTVSTLTEVGLLAGVEDIIDYAKEAGKPAVINISVGGYTGAHDGTSLFSQYLDMCAEEAVIVLSAGNEGSHKNSLFADFTPDRRSAAFRLGNRAWSQTDMYGATEIWNSTARPLKVELGLFDNNEKQVAEWFATFTLGDKEEAAFSWSGEDFPFAGELYASGCTDSENGRHRSTLEYDFKSEERAAAGGYARYELAVSVSGNPGEDAEVYADGIYTRLSGLGGPGPTTDRSVSDLACGFKVISVGMYGNRDSVPLSRQEPFEEGETYMSPTGYHAGETVEHSSYGTLRDGRVTPLTVAPGATLMSAISRAFLENDPTHPHLRLDGTPWGESGGTSMSAPYVAGYIATWLEADPTLTPADVRRIIEESNRTDIADADDPHNGRGYFDPAGALRLALQTEGLEPTESAGEGHIEVFDLTGVKRYAGAAKGLSGMEKGLYVVKTPSGVFKRILGQ